LVPIVFAWIVGAVVDRRGRGDLEEAGGCDRRI